MTFRPVQDELQTDFDEQLDEYERLWRSDSVPDIGRFIRNAADNMPFLFDLIELDLECRWRRYDAANPPSDDPVDEHGFPLFPRLEDYADIEGVDATRVLTPALAAEEYRARHLWGDRPHRNEYRPRFPDFADELDAELQQVDTDIQSEGASTPFELAESASAALNSTVEIRKDSQRSSKADASPVPPKIDNYEILDLLGRGGFGEVWKARRIKGLTREVAIKIPRSDRRFPREVIEKFKAEGEKMAALGRIPGIVTVFDAAEIDGRPYIISDYIEGESLEDRLQRETKLPHEEAALLVADIADALHAMHKTRMVHRDIKPANILLDKDGKPHIADFGLAVTEEEQLDESAGVLGTFVYMSPEQAEGNSHLTDGRTDIYSLGVVLYRLITGRLPYAGRSPEQYADQVRKREPRPPRSIDDEIPPVLEQLCLKCVHKEVALRFATGKELAVKLREYVAHLTASSRAKVSRRSSLARIGLGCSAAALCGTAAWQIFFREHKSGNGKSENSPPEFAEIEWSHKSRVSWAPLPDGEGVRVVCTEPYGLLSIGHYDGGELEFSAAFRQAGWSGEFGLFFAFAENSAEYRMRFHVVRLMNSHITGPQLAAIFQRSKHQTTSSAISRMGSVSTASLDDGLKRMKLVLKGSLLQSIEFGGKDYGALIRLRNTQIIKRNLSPNCVGRFGIWCGATTFIAQDVTRNGKQIRFLEPPTSTKG